ncbi:transglycosylase domain-containing protein [Paenibacillus sp. J22TS3]|uniref:transglycosylase domain-containing protein n=1 Tax=Paenibacillus sp. J22TS3 TaxID=2807192 RepID=UPI001B175F6F|nr:PBP1A family penicillin-binding protein [Paenibacillus sp. J22TS3]GIP19954.1 penicillin-binding protein 1F [Paenibacillus sp. J22TS3]
MSTNDNRPQRLSRTNTPDKTEKTGKGNKPKGKGKKKVTTKRVLWTMFFTMAFAIICAVGGYIFLSLNGEKILKENEDKLTIYETSKVYDRSGNLMGELSINKSEPVSIDQIPKLLQEAFVATEDKRFYEHSGVDLWSIGRAAVKDIVARSKVEGGSTITQQLAKNMFLSRDKTFFRKATEVSIAMALERNLTKDAILEKYLNRIYFGQGSYGIKAASQRYFGKSDLKTLDLWEIATLAALPKGPSAYNPISNPELSKTRRGVVLDLMFEQGYISAADRDKAKAVNYDYTPPKKSQNFLAFKDFVMKEAEAKTGLTEDQLNRGGYKIYTTMDKQAQLAVEKAFADDDNFEKSKDDKQVQAAAVIMNHQNGSLIALLGGRDYQRKGFSRVEARRQPGSAFKPIVSFAPALDTKKFTTDSYLSNEKQCFGNYCPSNLHGYSKTISMRQALEESANIPAVWLLNQVGVKTGVEYAKKMGITMDDRDTNLAVALGGLTKGTNTLEMAEAFSVFANGGYHYPAYSIKSIQGPDGKDVYTYNAPKGEEVISPDTAYYMTDMLEQVVTSGTGKRASLGARPVAGKTGTTQHGIKGLKSSRNRDAWFVGYTPEWTASIWMGYDNPDKDHLLKGSSGQSAALFAAIMKDALKDVPIKDFPVPKDLQEKKKEEVKKPTTVSGVAGAYNQDTGTVLLSWKGVDIPNVKYRVYRKEASEADFTQLLETNSASAEDVTVIPNTSYEYYVTFVDPATGLESERSGSATVSTQQAEPPVTTDPDQNNNGNTDGTGNGQDNNQGNNGQNNGNGHGNGNGNNGNNNGNGNNGNGNGNGSGGGTDTDNGGSGDGTDQGTNNGAGSGGGGVTDPGTGITVPGSTQGNGTGGTKDTQGTNNGTGNTGGGNTGSNSGG